jgi:BirA family biotin operon repressor/biotin-[acetyl-CoA-carboxylase] ligase
MTSEQLQQGWSPRRIGNQIKVFAETASTNSVALDSASDGLAVLADHQTAGRGRQGRSWLSPRGAGVLCSVLLITADRRNQRSPEEIRQAHMRLQGALTLAAAVGACEAIRNATEITPAIKWPNDLRIAGRKLGGILIESADLDRDRHAWAVGIGINCLQHEGHFPPELRTTATSLEIEAAHPIDRLEVARALLQSWDHWLARAESEDLDAIHSTWLTYAEPVGQRVRLLSGGREYSGRTVAVDPAGGLIVQADNGHREWFDPMRTTLL